MIAGLLTAAVLILVVTAVPFLRKFVVSRVRSLFAGVVPRMLDVLQRPQKLVTGIGGMLLLTGVFVMCLDASIRAFGTGSDHTLSYASVAVVFLTANALGSAAPTPGGVGAVELALSTALTIAGMTAETATSAVLLYRLLTFWLPVLPGWLCFNYLTTERSVVVGRGQRLSGGPDRGRTAPSPGAGLPRHAPSAARTRRSGGVRGPPHTVPNGRMGGKLPPSPLTTRTPRVPAPGWRDGTPPCPAEADPGRRVQRCRRTARRRRLFRRGQGRQRGRLRHRRPGQARHAEAELEGVLRAHPGAGQRAPPPPRCPGAPSGSAPR